MAPDKRDELYNNLINSGRVSENEIGTIDDFKAAITDEATAKEFHQNLLNSGIFTISDIGDAADFWLSIRDDFSQPTAATQPTAQQPTQRNMGTPGYVPNRFGLPTQQQGVTGPVADAAPHPMAPAQTQGQQYVTQQGQQSRRQYDYRPIQGSGSVQTPAAEQPAYSPQAAPKQQQPTYQQAQQQQPIYNTQAETPTTPEFRNTQKMYSDAADKAWQKAEQDTKALREANTKKIEDIYNDEHSTMLGKMAMAQTRATALPIEGMAASLKAHDMEKMANDAWGYVADDDKEYLIDGFKREIMREAARSGGSGGTMSQEEAEKALREEAERRAKARQYQAMYDKAVAANAPKDVLDFLQRKIIEGNSLSKLAIAAARTIAGTRGDMDARAVATHDYGKGHRVADIAGSVLQIATDPVTWAAGGVGKGAVKGATNIAERAAGAAATRRLAASKGGQLAQRMIGGSANFAAFEGLGNIVEQLQQGGVYNEETGQYEYSLKDVAKAAGHGVLLGGATGVVGGLVGNVGDKVFDRVASTAGKLAVRGGQTLTSIAAEGTIFAAPELISGEGDFDTWLESVELMAGFKLQHGLRALPGTMGRLMRVPESRAGFETRLRDLLQGRPDLALTNDEREELERGGYTDLSELAEAYKGIEGKLVRMGDEMPYDRFSQLMADNSISEAARAKMYYYVTGRGMVQSTVTAAEIAEHRDHEGDITDYVVKSYNKDGGVITSRTYKSKKAAEVEFGRLTRQSELNSIDMLEKLYDRLPGTDATTAKMLRDVIGRESGIDIDKVIGKEENRRTDEEKAALQEYLNTMARECQDAWDRQHVDVNQQRLQPDWQEAYDMGYNADEQQRSDISIEREDNPNDPQAQAAWQGVEDRIRQDAADRADQRRAEGERMAYKGKGDMQGAIRPLIINEDSSERDPETGERIKKTVYLVNGNIAIEPNGNGLSREGTDKTIYVYDPETGDTHELDPFGGAGVLSVGDVVSMEDYLADNEQQSQAEVQQEIDNATGKVNVAPNTPFVTPEGRQGIVKSVEGDNVIVQFADGEMEEASIPLADMQQYADALRRQEYEARHPQQTAAEQPQQPNTATEGQAPTAQAETPTEGGNATADTRTPAQRTYDDMQSKYGEKASHKVDVTLKDRKATLDTKKKALDKAQADYDDAPIGKEDKAEAALAKAQAEYDAALADYNAWDEVRKLRDQALLAQAEQEDTARKAELERKRAAETEAQRKQREEYEAEQARRKAEAEAAEKRRQEENERLRQQAANPQPAEQPAPIEGTKGQASQLAIARQELEGDPEALAMLDETTPRTLVEVAATLLASGKNATKLLKEDFKRETGYSDADVKRYPFLFAGADKGGITLARFGEMVVEAAREYGVQFDENDATAGIGAALELLGSVSSQADINGYITNSRIAEAYDYHNAALAAARARMLEAYGMTEGEYEAYMSWLEDAIEQGKSTLSDEEFNQLFNIYEQGQTTDVARGNQESTATTERTESAETDVSQNGERGNGETDTGAAEVNPANAPTEEEYAEIKAYLDEHPNASVSELQRKLKLGYNRATLGKQRWESERAAQGATAQDTAPTAQDTAQDTAQAIAAAEQTEGTAEGEERDYNKPLKSLAGVKRFMEEIGYNGSLSKTITAKDGRKFVKYEASGTITPNIYFGETTPREILQQFHLYDNIMGVNIPADIETEFEQEDADRKESKKKYWANEREKAKDLLTQANIPFVDVIDSERGIRVVFTDKKNENGNYTEYMDLSDTEQLQEDIESVRAKAESYKQPKQEPKLTDKEQATLDKFNTLTKRAGEIKAEVGQLIGEPTQENYDKAADEVKAKVDALLGEYRTLTNDLPKDDLLALKQKVWAMLGSAQEQYRANESKENGNQLNRWANLDTEINKALRDHYGDNNLYMGEMVVPFKGEQGETWEEHVNKAMEAYDKEYAAIEKSDGERLRKEAAGYSDERLLKTYIRNAGISQIFGKGREGMRKFIGEEKNFKAEKLDDVKENNLEAAPDAARQSFVQDVLRAELDRRGIEYKEDYTFAETSEAYDWYKKNVESKTEQPKADVGERENKEPEKGGKGEKVKNEAAPKQKIDDVGEKIGGARKDLAQKMGAKINLDADTFPKMFPKFDLKKAVEQGLDPKLASSVYFLRIAAQKEYKSWLKHSTKGKALSAAKFFAAYAKQFLENGNTSTEFKDNRWTFTEYGKKHIEYNLALYEKVYEKFGNTLFNLDLTGYEIKPVEKNEWSHYYRKNEQGKEEEYQPAYEARSVYSSKYYVEGELDKAIDELVNRMAESVSYKESHPYKLSHYYMPGVANSHYIGVKLGGKVVALTEKMGDRETSKYLKEHEAELQEKAKRLDEERKQSKQGGTNTKWKPELGLGGGRARVGNDYRNGKDVSADEFRETFGFRGVEFGNYVTQAERQRFINEAYDAMMDLAALLNVSPRALSLGGRLGFAIGARGGGSAMAHYEPDLNVINLTKSKGAGSLAHEWWHALDYYFNRMGDRRKTPATENRRAEDFNPGQRREMEDAFVSLMEKINSSDYRKRSVALDAALSKDYYTNPTELGARAFQDYVQRRLTDKGQVNDFLSSFTPEEQWNGKAETYPYPTGKDADAIDERFDNLFGTMLEREDEQGNVMLYERVDGKAARVSAKERKLRDAVVDLLRKAGIDVVTESEEGQRVLDMANGRERQHRVYHGSGADFERFDHSHMGEGEGAQAFGWGTYVTEVEGIGRQYAENLPKVWFRDTESGYEVDWEEVRDNWEEGVKRSALLRVFENARGADYNMEKAMENAISEIEGREGYEEELAFLRQLTADNFEIDRILYTVEIPEDNGSNYLNWNEPIKQKQLTKIASALAKEKGKEYGDYLKEKKGSYGENIYYELYTALGSQQAASELLHSAGFVGVKYPAEYYSGGRSDGAKNYVIFNESDLQITDKVKFFRTESGEAYGFTMGGKIYLDPRIATAETPIHEYTHLWAAALRQANPKAWEQLKSELEKDKDLMAYVQRLYPELKGDELMDEVFAHFSGRRGAERMRAEQERMEGETRSLVGKAKVIAMFENLRNALKKFWNAARELFAGKGVKNESAEDFANMALADLVSGFNPRVSSDVRFRGEEDIDRYINNSIQLEDIAGKEIVGYRYGEAPEGGRSYNTATNEYEKGVSMASVGYLQETKSFAVDAYDSDNIHYYKGKISDETGGDGEILLNDVQEISKEEYEKSLHEYNNTSIDLANALYNLTKKVAENGWRVDLNRAKSKRDAVIRRSTDSDVRFRGEEEPVFYSNAMRAVENIKQEKATPEQWVKMIEKQGGLKAGEDKWLGLSEWLKESKAKTLTKQEVLDFINDNMVQVEEVEYGGSLFNINSKQNLESDIARAKEEGESVESVLQLWDKMFGMGLVEAYQNGEFTIDENGKVNIDQKMLQPINETRLEYTTDGLDNKREIVLTVPTIEPWNEHDEVHFGEAGGGRAVAWVRFGETTDADGKRVLVIDEIQSNRHQEGREKGYLNKGVIEEYNHRGDILTKWRKHFIDKYDIEPWRSDEDIIKRLDEYEKEDFIYIKRKYEEAREKYRALGSVPDAPFDKNWHEVAMKRMLRFAAENGYDKVAWTKGEQQAERYDLGGLIDHIDIYPHVDNVTGERVEGEYEVFPVDKRGNTMMEMTEHPFSGNLTADEVLQYYGKDLGTRMMQAADKAGKDEKSTIDGDGLRIGGEGMKGFYDQILPRFMDKYGKKWGVKTGEVELPNIGDNGLTMWSVDVTDDMRESVMRGQPLFRPKTQSREGGEEAYAGEWYDRNSVERIGEFAGYTPKQIAKMNARQEESARNKFRDAAEKLHLGDTITFADSIDDVPGLTDKERKERRDKKGWYDIKTGKIVIILGNHKSMDDVMKSILHEGVAHHGLRQMFGEHFNTFLDNVYRVASPEIRDRINTMAKKHGWDFREATEEYLAMLAEDTDFERPENQSWWGKVKAWFFDMLHKIGFKLHNMYDTITDNELRYVLWRSYQNLVNPGRFNSVVEEAKDIAKQYDLKVGQWDETWTTETPEGPNATMEFNGRRVPIWATNGRRGNRADRSVIKPSINLNEIAEIKAEAENDGFVAGIGIDMTMTDGNVYHLWVGADKEEEDYETTEFYPQDYDDDIPNEEMTERFGKFFGENVNKIFGSIIGGYIMTSGRRGFTLSHDEIMRMGGVRNNRMGSDYNVAADGVAEDAAEYAKETERIEQEARDNGTWMKAPNGKRSNLDKERWVMVRTKSFKKWFGDWQNDPENASKALDENGEPRIVYHGTEKGGFTVFNSYYSDDKRSFFFSSNTETSATYSGSYDTINIGEDATTIEQAKELVNELGGELEEYWSPDNGRTKYDSEEELLQDWEYDEGEHPEKRYRIIDAGGYEIEDELTEEEAIKKSRVFSIQGAEEQKGLYDVFLNLRQPTIVDATDQSWNEVYTGNSTYRRLHVSKGWDENGEVEYSIIETISETHSSYPQDTKKEHHKFSSKAEMMEWIDENYNEDVSENVEEGLMRDFREEYGEDADELDFEEEPAMTDYEFQWDSDAQFLDYPQTTREVAEEAYSAGDDGVIFKELYDSGPHGDSYTSDVYVVFDNKNIKSANAKTFDNEGEEIGIDDRFNPEYDDIRFRDGEDEETGAPKPQARGAYERMVSSAASQWKEAMQDSMLSLKKLYQAVSQAYKGSTKGGYRIEDEKGYENAYLAENRMHSMSEAQIHAYQQDYMKPLQRAIHALTGGKREAYETLTDYMMAKHGLERNIVMAKRDAKKAWEKEHKAEKNSPNYEATKNAVFANIDAETEDTYLAMRRQDYAGLTALTGKTEEYETIKADKLNALQEVEEKHRKGELNTEEYIKERIRINEEARNKTAKLVAEAEKEAQRIVDEYEKQHDTTDLWIATNRATRRSLFKMLESGLLSPQRHAEIRDMFQYYIPLQGFDSDVAEDVYAYMGSDGTAMYGTTIRAAKGRKSKADDPIATIAMNGEAAIRRGNRNLMKQHFLRFVQSHPTDLVSINDVWLRKNANGEWEQYFDADLKETDTPEEVARKVRDFNERMEQEAAANPDLYKRSRELPNVPFRVLNVRDMEQHQVMVQVDGKNYLLTINGNPRAAQALNGLTNPDVFTEGAFGSIMNATQSVVRTLSQFYTTRNPNFVLSNFLRDAVYTNSMVLAKESHNYALNFHKNFLLLPNERMGVLFASWENGKLREKLANGTASNMEKMFYDFMMNGGETGWTSLRDIEKHKRDLQKALKREGNIAASALKKMGDFFDITNRMIENHARFTAYVTSIEMGRSVERAVWDAKEISVNFNKKGAGDKFLKAKNQTFIGKVGAFVSGLGRGNFAFWNASLQGLNNIARIGKRNPAKFMAVMTPLLGLGVAIPLLNALLGGDDDDDKNAYWNLPEYVRRSNICFRFTKDMPWITIPLPIEFRAVYGLGELGSGVALGKEHYSDSDLAKQVAAQFSQVLPLDFMEGGGGWHCLYPTYIKPVIEAYSNQSWTGLPIYRKNTYGQYDVAPEWQRAYNNTNNQIMAATKWLNEATGGDEVHGGNIDFNPARIEYMLRGYLGGYFTVADQVIKMGETATGNREFEWRNMMLANRVVKEGDERTEARKLTNEYFNLKEEYDKTDKSLKAYKKKQDEGTLSVVGQAHYIALMNDSEEYGRYLVFGTYKPLFDAYYKQIKEANAAGDSEEAKRLERGQNELRREMVNIIHDMDNGGTFDRKKVATGINENLKKMQNDKLWDAKDKAIDKSIEADNALNPTDNVEE